MSVPITKPTVGGDNGTWGTELNTALDVLASTAVFARKTADETVSASLTLQDDDHLTIALGVGTYTVEALLIASGTAGSDIKVAWQFSGTATSYRSGMGPTVQSTSVISATAATTVGVNRMASSTDAGGTGITTATTYGVDGANWSMILEKGLLVVTVAGTLKIQWAQVAASGSAIMRAGSYLVANQVA
jgi:hypothetical protein